uniref:DUF632 domain-containing protein n=2 Tax=Lactuca sativa TaxID=4236 RepID=A0A9R1WGK0_LACSA|nr:hypothetical protein LSAT_V11C100014590 [Lactuca sativa]
MGCSQSTIRMENKEAVNQCKERKEFMKQAISAHYAFAAAHLAYAAALKNTGAAFTNYALRELQFADHLHPTSPHPRYDSRRPPPQPDGGSRFRTSKQEMENENVPPPPGNDGIMPWDFFFTSIEDVIGSELTEVDGKGSRIGKPDIQRTMADDKRRHDGGGGCRHRAVVESEKEPLLSSMKEYVESMDLLHVITKIDDGFVKASESAHEFSKIIEANMLQHDSNSADNLGHTDHSTRVTTWKHLFKGDQISNHDDEDNYAPKEKQTHYIILDNILAWEKKLYDEVKAGEEMKYVYKKKIASLNKHTMRGTSSDSLMRIVSHLHTRCIVQMHSIDSTVSEINRLRDEQLYPKLVQLVKEMGTMWERMGKQHENQWKMVQELIKISQSRNETSEDNHSNTKQLHVHVKMWCSGFQKLILHQKEYVKSLNNWLELNLMSIDNNLRDKASSQQKPQNPKIQSLLRTWQDQLEKLQEEGVKTAINTFAAAISTIIHYQSDEMQMKERCEETRREITRKSRKFEEWCDKQIAKRTPTDVVDDIEVIAEHQIVMEALKRRLEEEEEAYRRQCIKVKDKSLMNKKTGLSLVFAGTSERCRSLVFT